MSSTSIAACTTCRIRDSVPVTAGVGRRRGSCDHPLARIVESTGTDFADVTTAAVPVAVDLWAPWCCPCRTVGPLVEQIGVKLALRPKIVKVNVDTAPQISDQCRVQGIPTLPPDDREGVRRVGALPEHALRARLDDQLATSNR